MGERFSAGFPEVVRDELVSPLREAVQALEKEFEVPVRCARAGQLTVLTLTVQVNLPTRGPVDGLDIRAEEPLNLVFVADTYPYRGPLVLSDRTDFPDDRLPHVNCKLVGWGAWLCLHRGNTDDWLAEHGLVALVHRARKWLSDAACGQLMPDGDGFEPLRLERSRHFTIVDEKVVADEVQHRSAGTLRFAISVLEILENPTADPLINKDAYALRQIAFTDLAEAQARWLPLARQQNQFSTGQRGDQVAFGLLLWGSPDVVTDRYVKFVPSTLGEFRAWAQSYGVDVEEALEQYRSAGLQLFGGIPISVVIRRPRKVLGTTSNLEFLHFVMIATGPTAPDEGWKEESKILLLSDRRPITPAFARSLSNDKQRTPGSCLLVGAGAIGSKLALHHARGGHTELTIVDNGTISPHNLIRYGLGTRYVGRNKAEAIRDEVGRMFHGIPTKMKAVPRDFIEWMLESKPDFAGYSELWDASASTSVRNLLVDIDLPDSMAVRRVEIADEGRLGFLSVEGAGRSPRLDDLLITMFDLGQQHSPIAEWLDRHQAHSTREVGSRFEGISIGMSCSSDTMQLADDVVSLHASSFSTALREIRRLQAKGENSGFLYINILDEGVRSVRTQVEKIVEYQAANDARWRIRMPQKIAEQQHETLLQHAPNEIGGCFVGSINSVRRAIYVTGILPTPADSLQSPFAFHRGVKGTRLALQRIGERTGGQIGYVGEWHTHPSSGPELSKQDETAVTQLRTILDSSGRPTCVAVFTKNGPTFYIFEPE